MGTTATISRTFVDSSIELEVGEKTISVFASFPTLPYTFRSQDDIAQVIHRLLNSLANIETLSPQIKALYGLNGTGQPSNPEFSKPCAEVGNLVEASTKG